MVNDWAGNFDKIGNSGEVDDSDGTGNFDRIEGLGKGGDLGGADDLSDAVENLSGERNGVISHGSLDAWEFHSQHLVNPIGDFSYATLGLSVNLSFCVIAMPVSLRVNKKIIEFGFRRI